MNMPGPLGLYASNGVSVSGYEQCIADLEHKLAARDELIGRLVAGLQALIGGVDSEEYGKLCPSDVNCAECDFLRPKVTEARALLAEAKELVK